MPTTIAILGLGEAGGALARDLAAAGATVRGYDPLVPVPAAGRATGTGRSEPAITAEAGVTEALTNAAISPGPNTARAKDVTAADTEAAASIVTADSRPATAESTVPAHAGSSAGATSTGATVVVAESAAAANAGSGMGITPADVETAAALVGAGIVLAGSEAEAVEGVDLVLSVNSSAAAVGALEAGLAGLRPGAVWADLNTASPGTKRKLAAIAAGRGVPFADVAIMAPVPGRGLRVPMLAGGVAAGIVATALNAFGSAVEVMAGEAGLAAERKLLRSVFFKGMSAAVVEALRAARAAGCEDWLRKVVVDELTAANASTVDRLVDGSYKHAVRRTAEMTAAAEMLGELGVRADIASAARDQLAHLTGSKDRQQS